MRLEDLFFGIRGHEALISSLKRDLMEGRIFHNYLFLGKSYQKDALIRAFAGAILGVEVKKLDVHPDFHLLSPTKTSTKESIKKDAVEAMIYEGNQRASTGSMRVFYVQEFSKTTVEGQNALLKTLEEPHQGTIFLLSSDTDEGILPTILSRSSVIFLQGMSYQQSLEELEVRGFSKAQSIQLLERMSGNGDRVLAFLDHENGIGLRGEIFSLLRELPNGGYSYGRLAKLFLEHSEDRDLLFYFLESWARDVAVAALSGDLPLCNEDMAQDLRHQGKILGKKSFSLMGIILEHKAAFRYNGNEQLILENLFLQLGARYG